MGFLTDWITNWLKELLIGGIMDNLSGLFDTVNARVGEIAVQVGTAPAQWNAGVFSLIRRLSETVILPIAGLVLTFVATYELIQLLVERNNLHDLDYWIFFKWIFKTACAILILSNTFNIVMAVFDVAQRVVAQSAGLIQGSTDVSPDMLADLEAALEGMDLGPLLGLWLQSFVVQLTMTALNIVIFVIVYGRMIEIYMLTSLAPLPVATLANRELGGAQILLGIPPGRVGVDHGVFSDKIPPLRYRNLYAHQPCAPPRGDPCKPGAGRGRAELSPLPVRRGLPGDADIGMRGDLRGTHSEYRRRRRPHRGDMGDHRLHGAAVLLPVQNGEYRPERPGGALGPRPLDTVSRAERKGGILSENTL